MERDGVAVSPDGLVVVGSYLRPDFGIEAFRWTVGERFEGLGDLPGAPPLIGSGAFDASTDAGVVVGYGDGGDRAFRWTRPTGMAPLGALPGATRSVAFGVSADGSVVVGDSSDPAPRQAFRWTAETGMVGLGVLPGAFESIARRVSAEGSTIVGNSNVLIQAPGSTPRVVIVS
jgi:probable HAF family extracellular repeat protein